VPVKTFTASTPLNLGATEFFTPADCACVSGTAASNTNKLITLRIAIDSSFFHHACFIHRSAQRL
jgi:hypothetical protein